MFLKVVLCSLQLHLFDQKYGKSSHIVNIIILLFQIICFCNADLVLNYYQLMIMVLIFMVKMFLLLNNYVETEIYFLNILWWIES